MDSQQQWNPLTRTSDSLFRIYPCSLFVWSLSHVHLQFSNMSQSSIYTIFYIPLVQNSSVYMWLFCSFCAVCLFGYNTQAKLFNQKTWVTSYVGYRQALNHDNLHILARTLSDNTGGSEQILPHTYKNIFAKPT